MVSKLGGKQWPSEGRLGDRYKQVGGMDSDVLYSMVIIDNTQFNFKKARRKNFECFYHQEILHAQLMFF